LFATIVSFLGEQQEETRGKCGPAKYGGERRAGSMMMVWFLWLSIRERQEGDRFGNEWKRDMRNRECINKRGRWRR
jgi:hypothetical protein